MKKLILASSAIGMIMALSACDTPPAAEEKPAGPPVEVSSKDLAKAFAENEVAAQGEYGGKTLVVSGKVQSIELDMMDKPQVTLPGTDDFTNVMVSFTDEAGAKTSALKKGQDLTVTCNEITEIMGSPVLNGCSF